MSYARHLIPLLERLDSAVVGCAGDVMLDRFVYGNVGRISPEAPIPVLHIESEQSMLGGLGNVVRNLGALGCGIRLFSVTGEDAPGREVEELVRQVPNCRAYLRREPSRSTAVKIRYSAHGQQLLRADHETVEVASAEVMAPLLEQFAAHVAECSIVFLSDYAKGVLKGPHAQAFIRIAKAAGKPVVVDPKGPEFERYRFATVIKPNLKELAEATGMGVADLDAQKLAARKLLELTESEFVLVTRGAAGMLLAGRDRSFAEFASQAREVYDVSGAGDTVAAVLAAALGSGAGMGEAAALANIAAGIVVGKSGTAVADRSEIIHEIEHDSPVAASSKILRPAEAAERERGWRRGGRRLGVVSGAFDPLGPEHLELLEQARSRCELLVVALDSTDAPAQNGARGPLGDLRGRALLLASLAHVDAVVICDRQASEAVIANLRPEVLLRLDAEEREQQAARS